MANCTIDVIGTSGEVLLSYTLSGVNVGLEAPIGSKLTIDDTLYSNIKYHTIQGDAIAIGCGVTLAIENVENFTTAVGAYQLSGVLIDGNYNPLSDNIALNTSNIEKLKQVFSNLGLTLKSFQELTSTSISIGIGKFNNETIELQLTYIDGIYEDKLYIKNLIAT